MKEKTIETLWLFSHPLRLRILELLGKKPRTIDEMTALLPIKRASTAVHVQSFINFGLLSVTNTRPAVYTLDKALLRAIIDDFIRSVGLEEKGKGKKAAKKKKAVKKKRRTTR